MHIQNSKNHFDVIVVGAGPAGSAAATRLSQNGFKVLLIDKKHFPREKVCGDCLTPTALTAVKELGLLEKLENKAYKLTGVKIIASGIKENKTDFNFLSDHPPFALVLSRKTFDYMLLKEAEKFGANIEEGFSVQKVFRDSGKYVVEAEKSGKTYSFESNYVILSTGNSTDLIFKSAGLSQDDYRAIGVAIRSYVSFDSKAPNYMHILADQYLWPAMGWFFPAGDKIANTGIGFYLKDKNKFRSSLSDVLYQFLQKSVLTDYLGGSLEILERPRSLKLLMGGLKRFPIETGLLLCGEAAGLVNPFTGEGMGPSMRSGLIACQTLMENLEKGIEDPVLIAKDFYSKLKKSFDGYFKTAILLRKIASSKSVTKNVIKLLNLSAFLSRFNIAYWIKA